MTAPQEQSKDLFCFAHFGEAQAFIRHFELKPKAFYFEGIFEGDNHFLLLTNEGEQNTSERISAALSALHPQINQVYNIGIAGALNDKLHLGEIHEIRTAYAFQGLEPKFRSFTLSKEAGIDCISSDKRVVTKEFAQKLSNFAGLVDRELWAVASSCQLLKKPLSAYKLISDNPLIQSEFEICEPVKEKAAGFSEQLLNYFLSEQKTQKVPTASTEDAIFSDNYFYFTSSQKHQYLELKSRLTCVPPLEDLRILKVPAKVRTQKLLNEMRAQLNPLQKKIQEKTDQIKSEMNKKNIQIKFSENLETDEVQFYFSAQNEVDLENKLNKLKEFSFDKVQRILTGKDL